MSLKTYQKKRDFKKTPEPAGKKSARANKKLVFVVQKHDATRLHYDFRLELNGVLLSWAVPKGPCLDPEIKRLAVHVEDHPLQYGKFEGTIPKGEYGAGSVMLWDTGYFTPLDASAETAYRKGAMHFLLHGKKLNGKWRLFRINKDDKTWLLVKYADEYAKPLSDYDITVEMPNSVKTRFRQAKLKKINLSHLPVSKMPSTIRPQLCVLVDHPPEGKHWLHEIKFDGYRILSFKTEKEVKLITRNNNNWTRTFQSIANEIEKTNLPNIILDGEVVILDDKQHSNFQLLQNSIKQNIGRPFVYYVFDILYYDKYNLMNLALTERKELLKKILGPFESATLRYSDHVVGSGAEVFEQACKLSLEGIVSKEASSPYIQKRNKNWLKIKCIKRQEFIICGYTPGAGSREYFGALLLGTYDVKNQLIYNGNVGTGFTQATLKSLYNKMTTLKTTNMPFLKKPAVSSKTIWLKPELVCEVEFTEWTEEGLLRHPSFKGLREDKSAIEVKQELEVPLPMPLIKLTNPNKILYPADGITKKNILDYYEFISEWMLPYLINRPISLYRCPNGIEHCFYQKHLNEFTPDTIHAIKIKEKTGSDTYLYIEDKAGLLSLVQLATLEIHCWNATTANIEKPDMLVFDLDPAPDVAWKKVVYAAKQVKDILTSMNLTSFVKTTGGKGLHVVVPIKPGHDWDTIKQFTHTVAEYMMQEHPQAYVSQMTKSKRNGKIFVDYLRNSRGATAIAPYSTRARAQATVATPLSWDELTANSEDTAYTIITLPQRLEKLKKDPWKDFFKLNQALKL